MSCEYCGRPTRNWYNTGFCDQQCCDAYTDDLRQQLKPMNQTQATDIAAKGPP